MEMCAVSSAQAHDINILYYIICTCSKRFMHAYSPPSRMWTPLCYISKLLFVHLVHVYVMCSVCVCVCGAIDVAAFACTVWR